MAEINIDCDGCLADFHGHIADWVDDVVPSETVDREAPGYRFQDYMTEPQWKAAQAILTSSDEFWSSLPKKPGAKEAVDLLLNFGHDITVVTAPWWAYPKWADARYRWLQKYFGIENTDVVITSKKWKVDGDILIEDVEKNLAAWKLAHPQGMCVMIPAPYNKPVRGMYRREWAT